MLLTYGRWQDNIPGEIDIRVFIPGTGGGFNRPSLSWDKEKQRYLAQEQ